MTAECHKRSGQRRFVADLAGVRYVASMFSRDEEGRARLAGARVEDLLQQAACGTPTYLYDIGAIQQTARALRQSFGGTPHLVAYAVKANSSGTILRALAQEGCGADVVSGGEL